MPSNSPFTNREAERIIMFFVKDELFPVINKLKNSCESIFSYKQSFRNTLSDKQLLDLIDNHKNISRDFFVLYKKFTTPDLLFESIKDRNNPQVMVDYFNFNEVVEKSLNEGFRLLEISERQIDRKVNSFYQLSTTILSSIAIVVSIAATLISFYSK